MLSLLCALLRVTRFFLQTSPAATTDEAFLNDYGDEEEEEKCEDDS
jgi:hypothetical protein